MAEIINLRRARKTNARAAKEARSTENRARFGRTKAERARAEAEGEIVARRLAGHRIPDDTEE